MNLKPIAFLLYFFSVALSLPNATAQSVLKGAEASSVLRGAKELRISEKDKSISFVKLGEKEFVAAAGAVSWLKENILGSSGPSDGYRLIQQSSDKIGFTHYRYQQYFGDLPVENAIYLVHAREGRIVSANGMAAKIPGNVQSAALTSESAFKLARNYINAEKYIWETPGALAKEPSGDGKLVLLSTPEGYRTAFKFDIYALKPLKRVYLYIDAVNGRVLQELDRIHTTDVTGTAETKYNGIRTITTDSYNGQYRLREAGRGGGIHTFNMNKGTAYGNAYDFTDSDNYWNTTANQDNAAYDAHFGTEATYDFYMSKFGHSSYDGAGALLKSYVHYDKNFANAFWDGEAMTYGDGDGIMYTALTSIDVVGHEITHGVTEYTAGLVYSYEPGALNESFSDIFGVAVDFFANPSTANYLMGDQFSLSGNAFRNMADPNQYQHPDTYKGMFWYTGSGDNGGVHYNSGVQNFWFYLLVNGGTGTNDKGNAYSVTGIGMDDAISIAYRSLSVYLTPTSQYADARYYSIQAAEDLFGSCTSQVEQTTNAWYAVGIGSPYVNTVSAGFTATPVYSCVAPVNVSFQNTSLNSSTYSWDFGDGNTSTAYSPTHTYTTGGTYSVRLIVSGSGACGTGSDTLIRPAYITISPGSGPKSASCTPATTAHCCGLGITGFSFNTISNTSGDGSKGYEDFSCSSSSTLLAGNSYSISVTTGMGYSEYVKAWIDYNDDGTFSGSEEVFSSRAIQNHTGSITIPGTATLNKPLRMRIMSDYSTIANACTNPQFGQAEDYTVTIRPDTFPPDADFSADKIVAQIGEVISFTDLSKHSPSSWEWFFPGGSSANTTIKNPQAVYNALGTYPVSLKVSNAYGSDSITKTAYISIVNLYTMCASSTAVTGTGQVYDSGGPTGNYKNSENCSLLIAPPCAKKITLSFSAFSTEAPFDFLEVYDGASVGGTLLMRAWGSNLPSSVTANSGKMYLVFKSDASTNNAGFSASWTSENIQDSPPVADFTMSGTAPALNTPVQFTDISVSAKSWLWDFGDGSSSAAQHPAHNYTASGPMQVRLIAYSCTSSDTVYKTLNVQAAPAVSLSPDSLIAVISSCNDSVVLPLTLANSGGGDLIHDLTGTGKNRTLKVLALTYGADMINEYPSTLQAINSYFTDYTLTESSVTDALALQNLLKDQDLLLIPENESGTSSVWTALAGVLQNFVSNGGTIVLCGSSAAYTGPVFSTGLFTGSHAGSTSFSSITVTSPLHPVAQGVSPVFPASDLCYYYNISNADKIKIAGITGMDFVTCREIGKGRAILIGADFYSASNDLKKIISNTFKWASDIKSPGWLSSTPNTGTTGAGGSTVVNVTFRSTGLKSGTYSSSIVVKTNDPLNHAVTVPCKLVVKGASALAFDKTCLNFGSITENTSKADSVTIYNPGCDTLFITSTLTGNSVYTRDKSSMYILPGASGRIKVTFSPLSAGVFTSYLSISSNAGDTTVCLDGKGVTSGNSLPPAALFTLSVTDACRGIVKFSDASSNVPTSWTWSFGDNTTSLVQNPSHQYLSPGTYSVTLTVSNTHGTDIYTSQVTVSPFHADITHTGQLLAGSQLSFFPNAPGAISWQWNFGDGSTSFTENPVHAYNANGKYVVELRTSNSAGCFLIITDTLQVGAQAANNLPGAEERFDVYPNPFLSGTEISYSLHRTANVSIEVYNATGELIATPVKPEHQAPGEYKYTFSAEAPGIYFVKLRKEGVFSVRKISKIN